MACRRAFITIQRCELSYTLLRAIAVYLCFAMDTSSITERAAVPSRAGTGGSVRVGIAGASGFAGQELLRWLAGHPHVRVTAAMSSSPDGPARTLPALARIWDGVIEPFSAEKLAEQADVVFLALPEEAAADDRAGAGRPRHPRHRSVRRVQASRRRGTREVVSGNEAGLAEARVRPDGAELRRHRGSSAHYEPWLLSDRRAAGARAAGRGGTAGRRRRHRRKVGHLGRRQEAERPDAFFGEPRQRICLRRLRSPA